MLTLFSEVDLCVMESVRLCAPAKSVGELEKCENGRRELIDLKCVPKDCSCNADVIDATNETQLQNCLNFRNQYVVNPCFGKPIIFGSSRTLHRFVWCSSKNFNRLL